MTFASYFARDVDDDPIPLVDDAYVPAEPEGASEPERTPRRLRVCRVLAPLWYIAFASMLGASYIYLLRYPLEPADHVWQAIPIGALAALLMWAVALILRRCAQREQT